VIVSHKYRVLRSSLRLYALGDPPLVKRAAEDVFSKLEWRAKWTTDKFTKDTVLVHYPGGLIERGGAAYVQACNMHWEAYLADHIHISLEPTNNPMVSLLGTRVYLKLSWFNKQKQESRSQRFHEALYKEFRKFEIPLVQATDWEDLVAAHPVLRCSPVWNISQ
jgi:hypothetical protein